MSNKIIPFNNRTVLPIIICKRLKGMEREDINFIHGVINSALLDHGISLNDPFAHEITKSVLDKLDRKGGVTDETG